MSDTDSKQARLPAAYRAGIRLLPPAFRRDYGEALREEALRALSEGRSTFRVRLALKLDLTWLLLRTWSLVALRRMRSLRGSRSLRRAPTAGMGTGLVAEALQAWRTALRRPAVSLPVVGLLALGTGGAVLTWLLLTAVLLRSLPYPQSDRLVALFVHEVEQNVTRAPASPSDFVAWKSDLREIEAMTAARPWAPVATGPEGPEQVPALLATADLFDLLEVPPLLGSTFPKESSEDHAIVVLSHDLWQRRYGGDRGVVGSTLDLDGEPHTIVGVMPPGFLFPPFWATEAEMWAPLTFDARELASGARFLRVFGRVPTDVGLDRAASRHRELAERLHAADPERYALEVTFESVEAVVASGTKPTVILLFGASLLLLGLAAADVAILLLGRASERERELAVRRALGASRPRLCRQWFLETFTLTATGAVAGLALGLAGLRILSPGLERWLPVTAAAELRAALSFDSFGLRGLAPLAAIALLAAAVLALAYAVTPLLGRASLGSSSGSRFQRGARRRAALLALEAGLTVVLIASGAFVARSTLQLIRHDPGFRIDDVHTVELSLAGSENRRPELRGEFLEKVSRAAREVPGVRAAGLVNHLPMGGDRWALGYRLDDEPELPALDRPRAVMRVADPGYAPAIGLRLAAGRWISDEDRDDSERVVVVNRALARRIEPAATEDGRGALGRRLEAMDAWWLIVGVVEDADQDELRSDVIPELFFPLSQDPTPWNRVATLALRSGLELGPVTRLLGDRIGELDPDAALSRPRTMRQIVGTQTASRRSTVGVLTLFGVAGGMLTAAGLYAVLSLLAQQRRREVGIRLALGESLPRARGRLLGWGLRWVSLGSALAAVFAIGAGRAFAAAPGLPSLGLGEIRLADPESVVLALMLVLTIAASAGWLASRRLTSVAPSDALRQD